MILIFSISFGYSRHSPVIKYKISPSHYKNVEPSFLVRAIESKSESESEMKTAIRAYKKEFNLKAIRKLDYDLGESWKKHLKFRLKELLL
ncbi:MAG: hypothetical protein JXR95_14590 [Deltaproteobacteria bacterium]|nr:hypothetical protein [Deltaproteobacteria bacterium]